MNTYSISLYDEWDGAETKYWKGRQYDENMGEIVFVTSNNNTRQEELYGPYQYTAYMHIAETLLASSSVASTNHRRQHNSSSESKDVDVDSHHSTENGSASLNGDILSGSGGPDSSAAVLAAREKSLISRAMDTVARTVSEGGDADGSAEHEEETFEVEGRLIDRGLTRFQLATPSPMPAYLNVHFICETASRLLFLSIHWVRSIPAFSMLR